jgi:ParB family chromosome partitioning protein
MELMRILNENAPKDESNRFQQLTITKKKLQEYFRPFYTKSQMEKVLFSLLEEWKKKNDETGS